MAGTLYVVATPVGNLEDVTLRAIRILGEVDLIAAEDTRHSRKLLAHFGIRAPLTSYYDQVERRKAPRLVERLKRGESIALISDAGTPGIADPGYRLVCAALAAGLPVVPVPGPSVLTAVLSVAGLPTDRFAFEGFVPARASARRKFFSDLRGETRTVVCFETARRLNESLADLVASMGERELVVAREVTKRFEEFVRGSAGEVLARLGDLTLRGEVTLIIAAPGKATQTASDDDLREAIAGMRQQGRAATDIARCLARQTGRSRREIYRLAVEGGEAQRAAPFAAGEKAEN